MSTAPGRWRALGLLSLAELLALSLWFSASAVLPAISREWALGDAGRAGLTIAVQAGFIAGTLAAALTNLPDLVSPRALMMWGALAGAVINAALALGTDHLGPALVLRFLTGVCLAGTYPPAMKIAATWFREGRGLAIGLLVAALTVGSATPHLIRGLTELPWRHTLLAASGLAAGGALAVTLVTEGPYRFPPARFDLRMATAVLRERGPRLACLGYFGHMWELYAMWTWLGVFLAASLHARGGGSFAGLNASAATFACVGVAGGLGAYAGGALADRLGRTALTMAAMALSGLCAVLIGFTFAGPPIATLLVAFVWGGAVIADSAQFSTAVTELAPAAYVGTALTTQTCLGFALTMASIWLIPPVVGLVGWRWAFATLAIGPALGVLAMGRLRALPEAAGMASGRR
ncbi:MAG TPA: MFS transporter [Verrucomicrobiae bacterium]|jgi:MFS family permease|nr:MFS transporter [Verrucomicrobiae bacterium]